MTPIVIIDTPFVSRAEWEAEEPKSVRPLQTPVSNLSEDYATGVERCYDTDECKLRVKQLQQMAFDNGRTDIAYHFLIGDDGSIYEGRGWNTQVTEDYDWDGYVVGFLGNFSLEHPPRLQMEYAINDLRDYAIEEKYLKKKYDHCYINRDKHRV